MKIIKRFILSNMRVNCFLVESNGYNILIDAPHDIGAVKKYVDDNQINIDFLLITHAHFDHILGVSELYCDGYIDKVYVPPKEITIFNDNSASGNLCQGFDSEYYVDYSGPISSLEELDTDKLGLEIKYIEGHSIQSAIYIFNEDKTIFSGDTLFKNAIGRTDFIYGNSQKLKDGIRQNILVKENYTVYPGHGFRTNTSKELNNQLLK